MANPPPVTTLELRAALAELMNSMGNCGTHRYQRAHDHARGLLGRPDFLDVADDLAERLGAMLDAHAAQLEAVRLGWSRLPSHVVRVEIAGHQEPPTFDPSHPNADPEGYVRYVAGPVFVNCNPQPIAPTKPPRLALVEALDDLEGYLLAQAEGEAPTVSPGLVESQAKLQAALDVVAAMGPEPDPVAWCPSCKAEVTSCDEDRCCESCGADLIVLADRYSLEILEALEPDQVEEVACVLCGCTDSHACPGGCSWVLHKPPVCSSCGPELVASLVLSGRLEPAAEPDDGPSASEEALDEIAKLSGCPEWEYPGQVVRDVVILIGEAVRYGQDYGGYGQADEMDPWAWLSGRLEASGLSPNLALIAGEPFRSGAPEGMTPPPPTTWRADHGHLCTDREHRRRAPGYAPGPLHHAGHP